MSLLLRKSIDRHLSPQLFGWIGFQITHLYISLSVDSRWINLPYIAWVKLTLQLIENVKGNLGLVLTTFVKDWRWLLLLLDFDLTIELLYQIFKRKFVIVLMRKTFIWKAHFLTRAILASLRLTFTNSSLTVQL